MQIGKINIDLFHVALVVIVIVAGIILNNEHNAKQLALDSKDVLSKDLHGQIAVKDGVVEDLQRKNGELQKKLSYVPPEGSVHIDVAENDRLKTQIQQLIKDRDSLTSQMNDLLNKIANAKTPEDLAKLKEEVANIKKEADEKDKKIAELLDELQQMKVVVQNKGFCLRPGIDLIFDGDFKPGFDVKFLYIDHFSLLGGVAFNPNDFKDSEIFAAVTTHVNLFIPSELNLNNLEIGLAPAYTFKDKKIILLLLLSDEL